MCNCVDHEDIEFLRAAVSKRIKESRSLKKILQLVAKHPDKEHKLYRCAECGQLWQGSRAWNWGNDEYLFRIPVIQEQEWLLEVFVQPDELMIFCGSIGSFLQQNSFEEGKAACSTPSCGKNAIRGLASCLRHHVYSLQKARMLPLNPEGRWFGPYIKENIVPDL